MTRLDAIERRLALLEQRAPAEVGLRFRGPWRDGERYQAGESVLRQGSLWIAVESTGPTDIPGAHGVEADDERGPWRLAAKRGKDATPALERRVHELERRVKTLERCS
jgi:hypothetical protein